MNYQKSTSKSLVLTPETRKLIMLVGGALLLGVAGGFMAVALPNPLFGFGAVAGLVVAYFMLGRPIFTLMVGVSIALLLPFAVIPVKLGITLTLLEASQLALFTVWLFRLALRSDDDEQKLVSSPFDWAVLLFLGVCLFAFILGFGYVNSSDVMHNFFKLMLSIVSFFAIINIVRTQTILDKVVKLLALAGSGAGYSGLALYILPKTLQERLLLALQTIGYPTNRVLRYVEDDPAKGQRATGTSVDPNSYGGLLVLVIALLFVQLVSPKPIFKRWVLALLMLGPAAALVLTYGRGAQLGTLVVIAFVATVKYRKIWLYAIPAAIAGWLALPGNIKTRFAEGFALQDPATLMRLAEYQNALEIIQRYPWFGVGFGNAPSVDLTTGVSMIYLTIAQRMGLFGLISFLMVMGLFFAFCLKGMGRLSDPRQQAYLLGFAGGIVGALAVGVLDHYFFNIEFSHMAALFWLFMALAVAQVKIQETKAEKNEQ
ncbi:O-antigen ligase family protein [Candidatus Chlorohelix sp.]|uniref:O-antigen ligase family protein n=1 Tax=Candidatus Chlorohelix sp. TaxID=3139201 RepID=UPI003023C0A4